MNLIPKRVRRWLAKAAASASTLSFIPPWVRSSFQTYAFYNLVTDGYKGMATVNACARILAWTFSEPLLRAYIDQDGEEVPVDNHAIRQLMKRPNPDMGEAEFLTFCILYAAVGGNVYLWKDRDRAGRILHLWPFHDGDMTPIPGQNSTEGIIAYYVLDVGDYTGRANPWGVARHDDLPGVAIPKSEIIHWKWLPDLNQPWRGIGALEAAAKDIDTANEVRSFVYSLLRNDAKPPVVINLMEGEEYDEDVANRLRAQWSQRYGGENRGMPAFLPHGMTVKELGYNLQQLQVDNLRDGPDAAVCMGFGIQPAVVGALVGLKHSGIQANFEEARRILMEMTLIPLWRGFASEFDQSMTGERGFAENEIIRFDTSRIAALQQNVNELWARVQAAWDSGLLLRSEARKLLGQTSRPADDVYKIGLTTQLLPAGDVRAQTPDGDGAKRLPAPNGNGRYVQPSIAGSTKQADYSDSVMVAFYPSMEHAGTIHAATAAFGERADVLPPDELHVTLVFLGKTADVDEERLLAAVSAFAATYRPVEARINGYGRFTNTHIDGMDAVFAIVDSQQLPGFRQGLVDALGYAGIKPASEHGFVPHMTLAYLPADEPTPALAVPDVQMTFGAVVVAYGDDLRGFRLSGEKRRHFFDDPVRDYSTLDYKDFPAGDGGASDRRASSAVYERQRTAVARLRRVREEVLPAGTAAVQEYFDDFAGRAETAVRRFKGWPVARPRVLSGGLRVHEYLPAKELTLSEWSQLLALIVGQEQERALEGVIGSIMLGVISESWQIWNVMLDSEVQFSENDPLVATMLQTAGQRVRNITESTRQQLSDYLDYGYRNGWSIADLANGDESRPGIRSFIAETYKNRAETIARTEIGDAQAAASAVRYEQMGVKNVVIFDNGFPNSHPTCTQLDGTIQTTAWYRENKLQHPNCLIGTSQVVAPNREVGFARWFEGEVVTIRTATDEELTCTPNHPVLTTRGWVAAGELHEGDSVIRSLDSQGIAKLLLDPNHQQMPTSIEDMVGASVMTGSVSPRVVPTAAEDFHGDGVGSEVHIETTDGFLRHGFDSAADQHSVKCFLEGAIRAVAALPGSGDLPPVLLGLGLSSDCVMSGGRQFLSFSERGAIVPDGQRFRLSSGSNARQADPLPDGGLMNTVDVGNFLSGLSFGNVQIAQHAVGRPLAAISGSPVGQRESSPTQPVVNIASRDLEVVNDFVQRLAGLVAPVNIVNINRRGFSGHVYNLQTLQGWYIADGIITHNCVRAAGPYYGDTE